MIILAKKGNIQFVKYDNGLYGVEYSSKSCGFGFKYSYDKQEMIDLFNEKLKTVRKNAKGFNLEIYARSYM